MKKMKIDWNNLIDAYSSEQDDYLCYLDTSSGTVMWKSSEVMAKVTKDDKKGGDKSLVEVPTISSREGWELMMDFVDKTYNRQLKNKLLGAVQGKGAFRRFKEILTNSPSEQKQWYLYQDAAVTKILDEWLVSLNIESQNTPNYTIKVGERVRLDKPPFEQQLLDQILFTADAVIGSGDRTFLALILKGSKAKAIKEKDGQSIPGYGAMSSMTIKQINELVYKTIQTGWLKVAQSNDNDGLLEHSRKGWDRVKELWSEKLLESFNKAFDQESIKEFVSHIMGRHREIRQYFLDILFKKAVKDHIPVVEAWKNEEIRKFRKRLLGLLRKLGVKSAHQPGPKTKQSSTKPKPQRQSQSTRPQHQPARPQHQSQSNKSQHQSQSTRPQHRSSNRSRQSAVKHQSRPRRR